MYLRGVHMKYCFYCNKSMPEDLENCFYCKSKLVDFKYKAIKFLFEFITYIGMFVTTTMCVLIPLVFGIGWLMNLMVTEIEFVQLLDMLKLFYVTPFINNLPTYIFVLIFGGILVIGLAGIYLVNKKMKNIIKSGDKSEVCSC